MSNGIYVPLSASIASEKNMDVTANNLANASTAGFKRGRSVFKDYVHNYEKLEIDDKMVENGAPQDKSFVMVDEVYNDYSVGNLKETGNPLDLAITGDAFFKVRKGGETFFQRAGNFMVSNTAFYIVLVGGLMLVAGYVLLYLNSKDADVAGITTDAKTRNLVVGLSILTIFSVVLYAIVPNLVG